MPSDLFQSYVGKFQQISIQKDENDLSKSIKIIELTEAIVDDSSLHTSEKDKLIKKSLELQYKLVYQTINKLKWDSKNQ